ncbi:hypothetical protein [Pseudoduganella namucuonensis]|uniref:Uncharacterized protein n=1 Tax=Pseudoduganella namucuonensis TaxID=1035707 RepID=A0A1I7M4K9_9BURK|nr:hypothetical protein [Pseudoduganella namucuonensis]SFV16865.1 hypothetical protein SAMN05216552_10563 [Pseudoduganella namucuonensis]
MTGKDQDRSGGEPLDDEEFDAFLRGEGPLARDLAALDQPRPTPEQDAAIQARVATMMAAEKAARDGAAASGAAAPGESPVRAAAPLAPLRPPARWLADAPAPSANEPAARPAKEAVPASVRRAIPPLAPRAPRWQERWRMPLALAAGVTAISLALPLWQQDEARQAPATAMIPDTTLPPPPPLEAAATPEPSAGPESSAPSSAPRASSDAAAAPAAPVDAPAAPPPAAPTSPAPVATLSTARDAGKGDAAAKPAASPSVERRDAADARKKAAAASEARAAQKTREKAESARAKATADAARAEAARRAQRVAAAPKGEAPQIERRLASPAPVVQQPPPPAPAPMAASQPAPPPPAWPGKPALAPPPAPATAHSFVQEEAMAKTSERQATSIPAGLGNAAPSRPSAPIWTPSQVASAKAALAHIEDLLNKGQRPEAQAELRKFRASHPGYPVPDSISEQLRAPSE